MDFSHIILFTGAGFTANFNGFLAREMWSWIFNNPKLNNAGGIKLKLREKFNFEEIYSEVFDGRGGFPEHEVKLFKEVVDEAYASMDKVIDSSWNSLPLNHPDVATFLNKVVARSADVTATLQVI